MMNNEPCNKPAHITKRVYSKPVEYPMPPEGMVYDMTIDGQFTLGVGNGPKTKGTYIKFSILKRRARNRVLSDRDIATATPFAVIRVKRAASLLVLMGALSNALMKRPAKSRRRAYTATIARSYNDIEKMVKDRSNLLSK